jgi:nucleoside-diphosphate-sugar epimerase
MRVFVTGASGYIGHAVAKAFRMKGHTVYGLVRTGENAQILSLEELYPIVGQLENPESYAKVLEDAEVVVHCAFDSSEKGVERDAVALDVILNAVNKNSLPRILIYTSGIWVYGNTGLRVVDEACPLNPIDIVKWRPDHEERVLKATSHNLRTIIIRPGCVYGGVGGLTNLLFTSTHNGKVVIPGSGTNRWAMVHVDDLAQAYVLAAEKELSYIILNIVDDSCPTLHGIALAVAKVAGLSEEIQSISPEEGQQQFGFLTEGLMVDQQVSNNRAKRILNWFPYHPSFINDVEIYYNSWKVAQEVQGF